MITFILVVTLGACLVVVLLKLAKAPAKGSVKYPANQGPPSQDLANLKVTDARPGDVISVAGAGDDMSDLDFTADRLTRFEAGTRQWFEVSGPYRERRVAVRVGGDEDLEVAIQSDSRKLTIEDVGVSENDLAELDERQNTADNFEFDGRNWLYRISREARSWRDDGSRPAGFYYWEFREENGPRILTIRKAEGEPFAVSLYAGVAAGDVTVYRGRP